MKRFFISIMFIFCATFSFGQQKIFVWSTVSGSNARVISMNSVKAEVMRLYDRHSWMRFETDLDGEIFMNRKERRDIIVDLYNWSLKDLRADIVLQQHRRQIITWYDNYKNFVYMRDLGSGMLVVSFVMGDTVMEVTFGNVEYRGWYSTRYGDNRKLFEEDIDWLLKDFPQTR